MEIRQLRVVLRARDFDATCRFYGEVVSLPRLQSWDREDGRGALFQAGPGVIQVLGRPRSLDPDLRDEVFDYQGPEHKMTLTFGVPSAERAYEELLLRDKNIPGGLKQAADGGLVFETHDPDGVRILFKEPAR